MTNSIQIGVVVDIARLRRKTATDALITWWEANDAEVSADVPKPVSEALPTKR